MNAPVQSSPQAKVAVAERSEATVEFERLLDQSYSPRVALQGDNMDKMFRLAETMSSGKTTVPKHLQGNIGDCMAVVTQAMQWNMNAFAVAQKTHLVNGTLGYEAQLVIAVLNSSAALATRLQFEWYGNWNGVNGKTDKSHERGVRVSASLTGEKAPRVLDISMGQVGNVRNSPNWEADPRQQIAYLCAKRWGRLHAPDVILGVYTPDELEEFGGRPERPRTATEFGEAARPKVVETDERADLIKRLEDRAAISADALAAEWAGGKNGGFTKEQRKLVGSQELERIKGLVPQPATTAAAAEQKKSDSPAPTYAELMDEIKAAANVDQLHEILSRISHLPDDQQAELKGAMEAKAESFGG